MKPYKCRKHGEVEYYTLGALKQRVCKICQALRCAKTYRDNNPDVTSTYEKRTKKPQEPKRPLAYAEYHTGIKWCNKCEKHKYRDQFTTRHDRKNSIVSQCRLCKNELKRNYENKRIVEDPVYAEACKEKQRVRGRVYKDKLRGLITNWKISDKQHMNKYFKGMCVYCKVEGATDMDHYIPASDPLCPGTVPTNIVPACSNCNTLKLAKPPSEWALSDTRQEIEDYFRTCRRF